MLRRTNPRPRLDWADRAVLAALILWGSNIGLGTVTCAFSHRFWRLCSGQVLAGKAAEDLFSADLAPGQVDLRRRGARFSGCELVKDAVRPGGVVVLQILGQDLAQVALVEDEQPVEDFAAQVPIIRSQIAFALGACGGLGGSGYLRR